MQCPRGHRGRPPMKLGPCQAEGLPGGNYSNWKEPPALCQEVQPLALSLWWTSKPFSSLKTKWGLSSMRTKWGLTSMRTTWGLSSMKTKWGLSSMKTKWGLSSVTRVFKLKGRVTYHSSVCQPRRNECSTETIIILPESSACWFIKRASLSKKGNGGTILRT